MRSTRGQALTEFAIAAPLLLIFAFGVWDIGRWVNFGAVANGAAQAGIHQFQVCYGTVDTTNINCPTVGSPAYFGTVIMSSDKGDIPDNKWNPSAPTSYNCNGTGICGDSGGCVPGDAGFPAGQTACFAVGYCTPSASSPPTCAPVTWCSTPWVTLPPATVATTDCFYHAHTAGAVVVKVVIRAAAISPVGFGLSSNGYFYIARQYYASVTF